MRRLIYRLKNYFLPTPGNAYHPGIFKKESVIALVAVVVFLNIGYFALSSVVFKNSNFLGAVLPGVLTALTNSDRTKVGVGTLTENSLLVQAAQAKANDMATKGYFSHVTPDGKAPWYWLQQAGYKYTYAGENLAVNFSDSKDVEDAWMKSPTHRANLVKSQFTQVGIAVANGTYKGEQVTFVVQFFGTPTKSQTSTKSSATATGTTSGKVLGVDAESADVSSSSQVSLGAGASKLFAGFVASPNHTLMLILGAFLFLIVILLLLAVFIKVRVQYLSVIFGGFVLIGVAGASFLVSETRVSNAPVELPTDTNSASVFTGFSEAGN